LAAFAPNATSTMWSTPAGAIARTRATRSFGQADDVTRPSLEREHFVRGRSHHGRGYGASANSELHGAHAARAAVFKDGASVR
jgi:hypothetical protein